MQANELGGLNRWWRVVGGLSMNLALGTLYGWSVFVAPLEAQFGWKRAETSMVFTIAVIVFALSFVAAGRLQDKYGPLACSLTGGILVSLGFYLCSFTTSLNYLYLCFGVIGGLGNGFGYATPIPVMAKWFPDKRGLAVGLAVGGYGAGSAIFGPLSQLKLIPAYGLPATFQILGGIFLVMTIVGALLLRNPPAGYRPAGWTPPAVQGAAPSRDFAPSEMLKTRTFYLMWLGYALGCSAGLMVISQLVPFAKSVGIGAAALSTMTLVVGAFGNASGRILSGWMSDRLGRINVLRTMIGICIVAMPALYAAGSNVALLYGAVFVVYWCYGTQLSVNGVAASDFWGTKNAGINYGILFTAWGVAGIIGPRIGGVLYDRYHDYQAAFYSAAALAAVALLCELGARRPGAKA
ncbi:L-lactate MFS transporter [Paludibaculum fermentans]|uniref:OFA family MFS transporter n=1 Tax=Paludibaculum fermentans TaxID=1473598 RepID=A0A7S7NSC3_PALFE|nr:OFA family MFS transporter [Paludibaculum fermentans]QOY88925.1 OFA family MFS transporter [Paludibaculum fermentans]